MPATPFVSETNVVGSHEKAQNRYGQNGYQGPVSDLPGGKRTTSGFLKQVHVPDDKWQTREVSKQGYAPAFGMKSRNEPEAIPAKVHHARG